MKRFYTIKSRVTSLYLSYDGTYRSKKPIFFDTRQVNYWIERFTNHIESYKVDEMVLESYGLTEPTVENKRLQNRITKVQQKVVIAKLKGYED